MARIEQISEVSSENNSRPNFSLGDVGMNEYRAALQAMSASSASTSSDEFAGKTHRNCADGTKTKSDKKNCGSEKV